MGRPTMLAESNPRILSASGLAEVMIPLTSVVTSPFNMLVITFLWKVASFARSSDLSSIVRALDEEVVLDLLQRYDGSSLFDSGQILEANCQRVHFGSNLGVDADYTFKVSEPGGQARHEKGFVQVPKGDPRSACVGPFR